jgi:hypothetical protein
MMRRTRTAGFPPIQDLRPPNGAPNVLTILIDDAGFGSSSAFGGPCQTPAAEKLAANGLKYTRFHTCALCAPTRQALLRPAEERALCGRDHDPEAGGGARPAALSAQSNPRKTGIQTTEEKES